MDHTWLKRLLGSAVVVILITLVIAGCQFYGVINAGLGRLCFSATFVLGAIGLVFSEWLWDKDVKTKIFVGIAGTTVWGGCLFELDKWARQHSSLDVQHVSCPQGMVLAGGNCVNAPLSQPIPSIVHAEKAEERTTKHHPPTSPPEEPIFSEALPAEVTVTIDDGSGTHISASLKTETLRNKPGDGLLNLAGHHPISIFVDHNNFFVDATITDGKGSEAVRIRKNSFVVKPESWDRNFSNNAIEVVDGRGNPVFQMIRRRDNLIQVAGVFISDGAIFDARPRTTLFKYPAWKYPGQFVEDKSAHTDQDLSGLDAAELQLRVSSECATLLVFNQRWDEGYFKNGQDSLVAQATTVSQVERVSIEKVRQGKNAQLLASLQREFSRKFGEQTHSLYEELSRRRKAGELTVDTEYVPSVLTTGNAIGPPNFKEACDYLRHSVQRLLP